MKKILLAALAFFLFHQAGISNISMPEVFSDNMVLQQNTEVIFYGWGKPGEKIVLKTGWINNEFNTEVTNQGTWKIPVKTPAAGGPFNISIKGNNEISFENVMLGEVWLCSGQSNMEWSALSGINNAEQEIKDANYPNIRLLTVWHSTSENPQDHFTGEWQVCNPESMKSFSAIAYFFARKLNKELGIPVGLINSSWGGTPAEAWMPEEVIYQNEILNIASRKQKPVPWGPVEPGVIYNSMIYPLLSFPIAGVLWYQGEANTVNAESYERILSSLIDSWRKRWGTDFPFYFAQIAPFKYGRPYEGVKVMDAQRRVLKVKNTGMIVLSDIGDTLDIHPKNKQDAGLRFANLALRRHYKVTEQEDSGPLFRELTIQDNKAVISFDHNKGLQAKGKKLTHFEIAGQDSIFYPADAIIRDDAVIVSSKKVKAPAIVRFAWGNTATPNLFNEAGLPASPFITDRKD